MCEICQRLAAFPRASPIISQNENGCPRQQRLDAMNGWIIYFIIIVYLSPGRGESACRIFSFIWWLLQSLRWGRDDWRSILTLQQLRPVFSPPHPQASISSYSQTTVTYAWCSFSLSWSPFLTHKCFTSASDGCIHNLPEMACLFVLYHNKFHCYILVI